MERVCGRRRKAQDKPRAGSYKGTDQDQKESAQLSYSSDPKEAQGCIFISERAENICVAVFA